MKMIDTEQQNAFIETENYSGIMSIEAIDPRTVLSFPSYLYPISWKQTTTVFLIICILFFGIIFNVDNDDLQQTLKKTTRHLVDESSEDLLDPSYCSFAIDVACSDFESGEDCDTFQQTWPDSFPATQPCRSDPIEITMLYTGSKCSESFTTFEPNCIDFNSGPSDIEGSVGYIKVVSVSNSSAIFFQGPVNVHDSFSIKHDFGNISEDLRVTIYSTDYMSHNTLLQESVIPFPCTETHILSHFDRIGALQFIDYTSVEQGHQPGYFVKSFDVKFNIKVINNGVLPTHLSSMQVMFNFDPYYKNFTNSIPNDSVLHANEWFEFEIITSLDPLNDYSYEILAVMDGKTQAGNSCKKTEFDIISWEGRSPFPTKTAATFP